ncbi:type II secretion system F family protein [Microbacterium sp. ZXX196]|uniref:type II secretion system F family protein n=1 Tax=Microbacterium sp. ZXX196 TaxID=2609291 RepID=UPI0034D2FBED
MGILTRRRTPPADPAETILPLAVLLQAGAAPAAAWRHLADSGDAAAGRVLERMNAGQRIPDAIAAERAAGTDAWGDVAAAWEVSDVVGAPLAGTLRDIAASLDDARELRDDVAIALAEPVASARLMSWLPVLGLVVGWGLGLDPLAVMTGSIAGAACLAGGGVLMWAGRAWTRRLVRAAQPATNTPGMHEELLAIALSGGASIERAQRVLEACGEFTTAASGGSAPRALALSRDAGVPAVELLRASAAHARHAARTEGRLRGARLSTRLLLPMGVCSLPAFLLLGVAPMLLGVLSATPMPAFAG